MIKIFSTKELIIEKIVVAETMVTYKYIFYTQYNERVIEYRNNKYTSQELNLLFDKPVVLNINELGQIGIIKTFTKWAD
jgi:hypothetical protein